MPYPVVAPTLSRMSKRISFREAVEAAAKSIPSLWADEKTVNFAALERYYKLRGHPISQPTLWRCYYGKTAPSEKLIEATHHVLGVPRALLRGEAVATEFEEALAHYRLSTLLLARKLENLPKEDFRLIAEQIELATQKTEQIRKAIQDSPNVESIGKHRH